MNFRMRYDLGEYQAQWARELNWWRGRNWRGYRRHGHMGRGSLSRNSEMRESVPLGHMTRNNMERKRLIYPRIMRDCQKDFESNKISLRPLFSTSKPRNNRHMSHLV